MFTLTKFRAYGIEADEAVSKRNKQIAIFNINSSSVVDAIIQFGFIFSGFWADNKSAMPGAFKAIQDINLRAESFVGINGIGLAGKVQTTAEGLGGLNASTSDPSNDSVNQVIALSDTSLPAGVNILSFYQVTQGTGINRFLVFDSSASVGGSVNEVYTVTGLLSTDKIGAVTPYLSSGNNVSILGISTFGNNTATVNYTGNPGVGAKVRIAVGRQGGNPVIAGRNIDGGSMEVCFMQPPGVGSTVLVSYFSTSDGGPSGAEYILMMESDTPDFPLNLPTLQFPVDGFNDVSGTSLVMEWVLNDGELPIEYEETRA